MRFEEVIVQISPAWPVYVEHSFLTLRGPPRAEDTTALPGVLKEML
jgi:hypothetical protein